MFVHVYMYAHIYVYIYIYIYMHASFYVNIVYENINIRQFWARKIQIAI